MNVRYDKALDIALGNNRKTKKWKNRAMQWSELLDRLAKETRTPETVAEYRAMSRDKQAEIKDVGGFVGGYCANGSRTHTEHRSILCLDADFADAELWPDWEMYYGKAAAVYSTHKHTPEKPRLRLVVPLARNVSPDEYQAIGRRVAATLGIDKFDDSSYQPQRMMYWPSCSQDGEYFFDHLDAAILDPDEVLATYHDWADVSCWPMSSRVADIARRTGAKQGDPLEKSGVIGAFCRAYFPISEVIAAYVPTYQPCDDPGRYTYTEGSTAAGVVVYEDRWTYSHHGTDPASGQQLNAWDLVRVHLFHEMDEDVDPEKPTSSRPSYKAMRQLALDDPKVRAQMTNDRTAAAVDDFAEPLPEEPGAAAPDDAWKGQLRFTEKGAIAQTIENTVLVLRHDPRLIGAVGLNELEHTIVARRSLPWREVNGASQWTDADDAALRFYLERMYGISSKDKIFDAVNVVAAENKFHPVRDYLDACTWDGVPRVETLLIDCLGADDTEYTRTVTRKTMAAAVARIYRPGCKFDTMLVLRGVEGIGKSALIAKLGGPWFSDTFTTMQGKDAYEQVQGVWIMEVGELAGMRKAEVETVKLYVSKQVDRFRPAYGRRTQEFPRQCVFFGTTNEAQFLRGSTGNRRFWVVDTPNAEPRRITPALRELLTGGDETVRQIWAEAVAIYKAGEPLHLSAEMETVAKEIQEIYEEENPRTGIVAEYLERLLPENWAEMDVYSRRAWLESDAQGTVRRRTVCTLEIWTEALGGNRDRPDRYELKEIRDIMATLPEWRHKGNAQKRFKLYGQQKYYVRS